MAASKSRATEHAGPKGSIEVVPNRLYYLATSTVPRDTLHEHYFSMDSELVYWNFFLDFGPLNLGQLYRFCKRLQAKLTLSKRIVYCSSPQDAKKANAIFLMAAYRVVMDGVSPHDAHRPFEHVVLPPFHDASPVKCSYHLTVLDCLKGLDKARRFQFFDFDHFSVDEYEHYEQVENGDLNWIVKGRICAFAGPSYKRNISPEGYCTLAPSDYIPYFTRNNVALVVRLNKKAYHEQDFVKANIRHYEKYYLDGSCPPLHVLDDILKAFESVPSHQAFAVHCKAGLGRTGTCIGAYLMKHYRLTAAETIGWLRICRPGSVIGPQQQFLKDIQDRMWQQGSALSTPTLSTPTSPAFMSTPIDSDTLDRISVVTPSPRDAIMEGQQADSLRAQKGKNTKTRHPITPDTTAKGLWLDSR